MAHNPKIEIYKLILERKDNKKPITFRELFRVKTAHYYGITPTPKTSNEIFHFYVQSLLKAIGDKKYQTDKKKNKGFTIATEIVKTEMKTLLEIHSEEGYINGILEGGKYNANRTLGEIDDTSKKSKISKRNIVSDQYYFLLYTPLDHSEGVIIIQSYTESKISDILKKFLKEFFCYSKEWSSKTEIFIPQKYRDDYLKGAKFQKVTFSSRWNISDDEFEDITKKKEHEVVVKIEIIDKNAKKTEVKRIREVVAWLGQSKFKLNRGVEKELNNFDNFDAKMESNGKGLSYNFDDENEIIPSIVLSDKKFFLEENEINFEEIKNFCINLLAEILQEILPESAIKEL